MKVEEELLLETKSFYHMSTEKGSVDNDRCVDETVYMYTHKS